MKSKQETVEMNWRTIQAGKQLKGDELIGSTRLLINESKKYMSGTHYFFKSNEGYIYIMDSDGNIFTDKNFATFSICNYYFVDRNGNHYIKDNGKITYWSDNNLGEYGRLLSSEIGSEFGDSFFDEYMIDNNIRSIKAYINELKKLGIYNNAFENYRSDDNYTFEFVVSEKEQII